MNIKELLNPRFNKRLVISVQVTSSDDDENNKSKELELGMHQVFDNINQILRQILDLAPKGCIYNSSDMEEDNPSLFPKADIGETSKKQVGCNEQVLIEQEKETVAKIIKKKVTCEDAKINMSELNQDKEIREIEHLRRQNGHLNQINDQLVKANTMLKQDLQEVNQNFAKLIQVSEEAVKRRRMVQEEKD